MYGKKGILYTLGLTLFAIIILGAALLIMQQKNAINTHFIDLSFAQQIKETDLSIQELFSEIVLRKGNMSVSIEETSLTIQELLIHNDHERDLLLEDIETKIEGDFTGVDIDLTEFKETHAVILQPVNISYSHPDEQSIQVDANQNIQSYTITVAFSGNISSCSTNFISGGGIDINFIADSDGDTCVGTGVDLQSGEINLTVEGNNFFVTVEGNGLLQVQSPLQGNSSITINYDETENAYAQIPIQIQLSDPYHNFSKKGPVQLFLLS